MRPFSGFWSSVPGKKGGGLTLVLEGLCVGYNKTPVVSGVSLDLPCGKVCGLMGRNGSGKTTLLKCIAGLMPPLSGRVTILEKNIHGLSRQSAARIVSLVPQVSHTPFDFSCLDMVLMARASRIRPWAGPDRQMEIQALDALGETGISHLAGRSFNTLSGGERQLVMLARAIFQKTPVMLLDEPTAHLDFPNQHRIMRLMKTLAEKKNFCLVITLHDPNLTHYYCHETIMIHQGRVAAQGPVSKVMTPPVLKQVLGKEIHCDHTRAGVFVVTPKPGQKENL
ncbi:MAG: ABC transporter ATP-binding protein [Desulfobacter sp.]|nr:MAG: ABC transporter ATP-binding protein [Desulfobacter sp.]